MTCFHINTPEVSIHICGFNPCYRLPLPDGRRIFMEWHSYLGPSFFHDRYRNRVIDDWYKDRQICQALDWFEGRGNRA